MAKKNNLFRRQYLLYAALLCLTVLLTGVIPGNIYRRIYNLTFGRFFRHTVESRLSSFSAAAEQRLALKHKFKRFIIIALKAEKQLELWGETPAGENVFIKQYSILAASGKSGPKLREGDRQVPEGFYQVESLHPNSHFYLALKIAYPSREDIAAARLDGRSTENLGSNIMLHGRGGSVGCIAVENQDMEEIFWAAAQVGAQNIEIIILPCDFRNQAPEEKTRPEWLKARYEKLCNKLKNYPQPIQKPATL